MYPPDDNTASADYCSVIDGHVDLVYMMMQRSLKTDFCDLSNGLITLEKLSQGAVRVIVSAFYCQDRYNGPKSSALHLRSIIDYAEENIHGLVPVKNKSVLKQCFCSGGQAGVIFLLENADALIDQEPLYIQNKGFSVIGLTHAGKNRIGDGNGVKAPEGLTNKGKKLVKKLYSLGMIIDIAHLAEPGFWDLMDLIDGLFISSHTGFRSFCDLPRNLSDEQLNIIVERGGMIGLSVNPEMLSIEGKADIVDIYRQADWFVQKFGVHNIGIGSDFGGFDLVNQGLEHPGRFTDLAEIFAVHGYPEDAISNIMGKNWYLFYSDHFTKNHENSSNTLKKVSTSALLL